MNEGNKMRKPSLKNQKIYTYVFFSMWVLLSTLILAESAMPDTMSSSQSDFVGNIFQKFFPDDKFSQETAPISFETSTDDIVFSENGISQIVIGTTTTYNFKLEYPELKDNQYKKDTFKITKSDPNDSFTVDENLINLGSDNYQMSIKTYKESKGLSISIEFSENLKYELNFDICPRYIPSENVLKSLSASSISIGKNESFALDIGLLKNGEIDNLLSPRYYDLSKLAYSSENEEVATIDEEGMISGKEIGTTKVTYGPFTYDVTVSPSDKVSPDSSFTCMQTGDFLAIDDVDYLEGGQTFTFSFNDENFDDSFDFELIGENINSSAILFRKSKNSCLIKGVFEEKEVSLLVKSSLNPSISKTISLAYGEVKPTGMNGIFVNGAPTYIDGEGKLNVSVPSEKDLTIRGAFLSKNRSVSLAQESINLSISGRNVTISKNDTLDCSIKFATIGDFEGTITSLSDPTLKLDVKFTTYDSKTNALKEFLTLVRKSIGHFSLFMVEAIFMFLFLYNDIDDKFTLVSAGSTIFFNFVIAGFSELIQYFTPGRTCTWKDVGIDTLGATFGVVLCLLIVGVITLIKYLKKRKVKQN